jgi:hypothetical protein
VVIRRVIARATLRAEDRRPEKRLRKGVTIVPKRGVRVVQTAPPAPALSPDQVVAGSA